MDNNGSYSAGSSMGDVDAVKRKKDSLTLDFNASSKKARTLDLRDGILSSPDVGLLKLATPDLEQFIIHQSGVFAGTPTQILFPKTVTEEQEAYARGFVDALVELHMKQSPLATSRGIVCMDSRGSPYVALAPVIPHLPVTLSPVKPMKPSPLLSSPVKPMKPSPLLSSPVFTRPGTLDLASPLRLLSTIPPFTLSSPLQADTPVRSDAMSAELTTVRLEESVSGAQHVPDMSPVTSLSSSRKVIKSTYSVPTSGSSCGSTPLSPIDMSNQERIKLERKREKNRTAAQRCRSKKLERITRLESRVMDLKRQNVELSESASSHKDVVNRLRQQIFDHVNGGRCQIMVGCQR